MSEKIEAGYGWRLLENGEPWKEGDEWLHENNWSRQLEHDQRPRKAMRRRIDPGEGWEIVPEAEVKSMFGALNEAKWEAQTAFGWLTIGTNFVYRRRVKESAPAPVDPKVTPLRKLANTWLQEEAALAGNDATNMGKRIQLRYCVAELLAALAAEDVKPKLFCEWFEIEPFVWGSRCGATYQFTDGGPMENGHVFCHNCGFKIKIRTELKTEAEQCEETFFSQWHRSVVSTPNEATLVTQAIKFTLDWTKKGAK